MVNILSVAGSWDSLITVKPRLVSRLIVKHGIHAMSFLRWSNAGLATLIAISVTATSSPSSHNNVVLPEASSQPTRLHFQTAASICITKVTDLHHLTSLRFQNQQWKQPSIISCTQVWTWLPVTVCTAHFQWLYVQLTSSDHVDSSLPVTVCTAHFQWPCRQLTSSDCMYSSLPVIM